MPVAMDNSALAAFEVLCENLNLASFEDRAQATDEELTFLAELFQGPIFPGLLKAHDTLEDSSPPVPISCDNIETLREVTEDLVVLATVNSHAKDLYAILKNPYFKGLIDAHDDVASKNYEALPDSFPILPPQTPTFTVSQSTTDAIRMVGIRKNPDESLGITVRSEERGLVIARILAGSMIDKQGMLHVGDVIKEINGQEVMNPDQLQEIMRKANGNITLKILPTTRDQNSFSQVFLKAHFSYDPKRDNLIPCREAGLAFRDGDILQVVNMEDVNWWQALKVGSDQPSGLIPAQQLEEKRKAFVRPEYDYTHNSLLCGIMTKRKKKMMYHSRSCAELDRTEMAIYEEVARMPPFQRKSLVLIGAKGVGRRTLKSRLIKADPSRFAGVLPHTSRPMKPGETNGDMYWFVTIDEMILGITQNHFAEHGDFDGQLYGTKFDTIRHVIRSGRMCVLDISPQAIKTVKTPEFMPYVVFIGAPPVEIMRNMYEFARQRGKTDRMKNELDFRNTLEESARIERQYKHFFDLIIVNDNLDAAYDKLRKAIETLSTEEQWVPVTWVY